MTAPRDAEHIDGVGELRPGEIVPVIGADADAVVAEALAVRDAGGVPLIGDDRWPPAHWAQVRDLARRAAARPGIAWAALTSGSTGAPRVVLRSAASWEASFPVIDALLERRPDDVLWLPSPPASSLTLFSIAHAHHCGMRLALASGHALSIADAHDATLLHGTPRALRSVVDAVEGGAGTSLRAALVGGSEVDSALRARAEALGIRVIAYYGAAELSFVAADTGDGLRPIDGVEVGLRGDVLWVRSPFVSAGYLTGGERDSDAGGDEEATGPFRTDGAGWSTVGDRASMHGDRITLLGRSDDAILTASATVVPSEVEAALRALPGIGDAVVFGLPNAGVGALVAAVLEPDQGGSLPSPEAVRAGAAAALGHAHLPRRWFALDHLPRTASGKPARAAIVRSVLAGEVSALGDFNR